MSLSKSWEENRLPKIEDDRKRQSCPARIQQYYLEQPVQEDATNLRNSMTQFQSSQKRNTLLSQPITSVLEELNEQSLSNNSGITQRSSNSSTKQLSQSSQQSFGSDNGNKTCPQKTANLFQIIIITFGIVLIGFLAIQVGKYVITKQNNNSKIEDLLLLNRDQTQQDEFKTANSSNNHHSQSNFSLNNEATPQKSSKTIIEEKAQESYSKLVEIIKREKQIKYEDFQNQLINTFTQQELDLLDQIKEKIQALVDDDKNKLVKDYLDINGSGIRYYKSVD